MISPDSPVGKVKITIVSMYSQWCVCVPARHLGWILETIAEEITHRNRRNKAKQKGASNPRNTKWSWITKFQVRQKKTVIPMHITVATSEDVVLQKSIASILSSKVVA